ncbi:MAG TPA: hypothetical protein RMG45_25820, partial [Polyangiaceae bacterium LLY-WYZ-15_(1-7)]|nr:hypothetical protein [Polyangiaceae bacterium LLY-WYZ-15_(1-7)]
EGAATVDGAPAAGATVLFHDLDGDARVEVPVREGRYAAQLHPGRWAVYLDARDAPGLPPVRALVEPALTLEGDGLFDVAASRVRLRGVLTVDGAEAPSGGDDARLGYLQLVDELGVASRGVDVAPGGAFDADLLATRADVRFLGTHPALPRLPTIVASGARPSDVPVRWDLPTRWLEVRLTVNGRPLPEGRLDVAGGRGVVLIEPADGGTRQELPLPPRGAAIAGARVPPGVWRVRYRNALHPTMPRAERSVGEVDLREESEAELVADLEVVELAIDAPVAALLRFTDLEEEAHAMVPLSSGRATTWLFGGVYRVRRASDGRLLSGWLRLRP